MPFDGTRNELDAADPRTPSAAIGARRRRPCASFFLALGELALQLPALVHEPARGARGMSRRHLELGPAISRTLALMRREFARASSPVSASIRRTPGGDRAFARQT